MNALYTNRRSRHSVRKSRYDDLIKPIIERQNAEREAWNRGRERIINAQIQHDAKLH